MNKKGKELMCMFAKEYLSYETYIPNPISADDKHCCL